MRHTLILKIVLVMQVFFTSLFVFKISADILSIPLHFLSWSALELIDALASIGMLIGVVTSILLVRMSHKRLKLVEGKIEAASGELHDYLQTQFASWGLTPTENNVALLIIKGFSNHEIAELRGTTESTVKSQISAIFRKSGVSSRQQLVTWVVDDLVDALSPTD